MCQQSNQFIFCSCVDGDPEQELKGKLQWALNRYIGSRETNIRGKILKPSHQLNNVLNVDEVIDALNSTNCFDFDYNPKEMDCLHLSNGLKHPDYAYFSIVYRDGEWQKGSHPPFTSVSENISRGGIKFIPEKKED
jgi:hypothetical protein